jgi:hypothetical protein
LEGEREGSPEEVWVTMKEIPRPIRLEDDAGQGGNKAERMACEGEERARRSGLSSWWVRMYFVL